MDSGAISPDGPLPSPLPTNVTDFVRKLHDMLEDRAIENIVCWGPQNDCFMVKDINKFSVSVLPQIFNHSNFASFVRQLNKYDFHKLKQGENQFSVFYHQHFHRDRPHDFQYIKRKVTSTEPRATEAGDSSDFVFSDNAEPPVHSAVHHTSSSANGPASLPSLESMEKIVEHVMEERDQLWEKIRGLEKNTGFMQSELGRMKNEMGQNDFILESLRNRMGSSTELGNVTSVPPFSTPMMMEGTRNVPSSGLNRISEPLTSRDDDSVPGLDTEEMATRPSADSHGISFPTNRNTRRQDSTFASPLRSFAFGSQSRSGQPTPVTLPMTTGFSTATDRGLPTEMFMPTHGWSNAPSQGGLYLQESHEIPQDMEIRRPGQAINDANSGFSHRPNSSPALFLPKPGGLRTLDNIDTPTIGFDGRLGRRGRSFSLDHRARFHVEALTSVESRRQVRRQSSDAQSMYAFTGSSGSREGVQFTGEHNLSKEYDSTSQGELRGSDGRGAVYGQTGDRGTGAVSQNMDLRPAPFRVLVAGETVPVGRWSFDTSTVATDGMLHGLGIAVGGPHPTNAESDAVLVDCDSDPSPAMLESD